MIDLKNVEHPFKFYCQKVIPLAFDESMSYYEVLCGLRAYIDSLIKSINQTSDAVTELQNLYKQLVEWIDNYFENLDVQEEINNKLDEMAESGELASIIAQFIRMNCIIAYDTISDLKANETLINGSVAKTCGKETYHDGLGAFYRVRLKEESDVPDDYNLVALTNSPLLICERLTDKNFDDLEDYVDENIEDLQQDLSDLSDVAIINLYRVLSSYYYYIDAVNGDDSNDGSQLHPFKSFEKIIELINKGHTDIRCSILTTATYEIDDYNALTNFSIHISSELTGDLRPTLQFARIDKSIAWYNCHVALTNIKLSTISSTSYRMYFEGCTIGFTNVDATGLDRICFMGSCVQVENLTTNKLEIDASNGYINGLDIRNTNNNDTSIRMRWCGGFRLFGNLSVANLSNTGIVGSCLLQVAFCGGVSVQFNTESVISNKYYNTLWLENSTLFITRNRENIYKANFGSQVYYNNCSIIRDILEDSGWLNMTIEHGTGASSPYKPRYRKLNDVIYLQGAVSGLSQGDIITTLPEGFRPVNRITCLCTSDDIDSFINIRVNESGQVSVQRMSGTSEVILDNVIYPAN